MTSAAQPQPGGVPAAESRAATTARPPHGDGDGWVECGCGERHWGRFGAGGLFLVAPGPLLLLQHRAVWSHHGGTWGLPGGARHSDEDALGAALREAGEETGVDPGTVRAESALVLDHGTWSYTTVLARIERRQHVYAADAESIELRWVPFDAVPDLPLHPGFGQAWPRLRELSGGQVQLVVDAANVLGTRPDGWWRDRPGATARLLQELVVRLHHGLAGPTLALPAADLWWPAVKVVVEGQARSVPDVPPLRLVRADGSGDDAVVEVVAASRAQRPEVPVVVVTADRGLRSRVEALGAGTVAPRAVLGNGPG